MPAPARSVLHVQRCNIPGGAVQSVHPARSETEASSTWAWHLLARLRILGCFQQTLDADAERSGVHLESIREEER
jgi:hypothetical protein